MIELRAADDESSTLARIGTLRLRLGDAEQARKDVESALEIAGRTGSSTSIAFGTFSLAMLTYHEGRPAEARRLALEALVLIDQAPFLPASDQGFDLLRASHFRYRGRRPGRRRRAAGRGPHRGRGHSGHAARRERRHRGSRLAAGSRRRRGCGRNAGCRNQFAGGGGSRRSGRAAGGGRRSGRAGPGTVLPPPRDRPEPVARIDLDPDRGRPEAPS